MRLHRRLRELHAPRMEHGTLYCDGCDNDGWESGPPEWPCRTAKHVYHASAIRWHQAVASAERVRLRRERERRQAEQPSPLGNLVSVAYDRYIEHALSMAPFARVAQ